MHASHHGHGAGKFWWFSLFIFLILDLMTFYGIATVFATPDLPSATVLSAMSYGFWNLFAGFILPLSVRLPMIYSQCLPWLHTHV